jgi:putative ABC transport system ATP-binding protein/lipoprotein-releasing system ATP-binding protein
MSTIIQCKDLVKSFDDPPITVLKSISFEVEKSEFLSITGRSGSGKSTLLYVTSGLDTITSGEVIINGKNVHALGSIEIHRMRNISMGFVFQFHYLLPEISAFENILMPARKIKQNEARKDYALFLMKEFNIAHCRDKLPAKMSGGELQRTAIARALIMEPEILFADEPTGNLDSENGKKIMDIFRKVNRELGTTIVMVTHESDYAKKADRTIHLIDGKIARDRRNRT